MITVFQMSLLYKCFFQPVVVMLLVLAICNALIQRVNVHAMLASKALHVMQLVVAILLVPVGQLVMLLQASALAILVILERHVIPVLPTTIEKVMELVQVILWKELF